MSQTSRPTVEPAAPAGRESFVRATEVWLIDILGEEPPDCLDQQERDRAAHFVRAADATRFRRSRIALRYIIGARLGLDPKLIELRQRCPVCEGSHGPISTDAGLHVSLSRCGPFALVAIGRTSLGVDIASTPEALKVLDFALSPDERLQFSQLGRDVPRGLAATIWTRKEAYLKALGLGLRRAPSSLSFPLNHGAITVRDDDSTGQIWRLDTALAGMFACTVCVPASDSVTWRYSSILRIREAGPVAPGSWSSPEEGTSDATRSSEAAPRDGGIGKSTQSEDAGILGR